MVSDFTIYLLSVKPKDLQSLGCKRKRTKKHVFSGVFLQKV